jgi:hypothetical protein
MNVDRQGVERMDIKHFIVKPIYQGKDKVAL